VDVEGPNLEWTDVARSADGETSTMNKHGFEIVGDSEETLKTEMEALLKVGLAFVSGWISANKFHQKLLVHDLKTIIKDNCITLPTGTGKSHTKLGKDLHLQIVPPLTSSKEFISAILSDPKARNETIVSNIRNFAHKVYLFLPRKSPLPDAQL